MSTSHLRADPSDYPASPAYSASTAHMSKRARALKLEMSAHLRAVREEHGLDRSDVHDRPTFVKRWEDPTVPHAPNLLHIVEQGSDPVSRPVALAAIEWARKQIARAEEHDPRQLSLLDLIAATSR